MKFYIKFLEFLQAFSIKEISKVYGVEKPIYFASHIEALEEFSELVHIELILLRNVNEPLGLVGLIIPKKLIKLFNKQINENVDSFVYMATDNRLLDIFETAYQKTVVAMRDYIEQLPRQELWVPYDKEYAKFSLN